jgi:hypothetical protein
VLDASSAQKPHVKPPKPPIVRDQRTEAQQKEWLARQKYSHPMWHFSYASFVKIEVDRKSGPAKSRAFAFNHRAANEVRT